MPLLVNSSSPRKRQGCPGRSGISESELVLSIGRGRRGAAACQVGDGSVFEQPGAHQVCRAQCEQLRAAVARGEAQQQISDHRGQDLQANSVFGTAEKGADLEMLLEPAKQQLDLPSLAVERGKSADKAPRLSWNEAMRKLSGESVVGGPEKRIRRYRGTQLYGSP